MPSCESMGCGLPRRLLFTNSSRWRFLVPLNLRNELRSSNQAHDARFTREKKPSFRHSFFVLWVRRRVRVRQVLSQNHSATGGLGFESWCCHEQHSGFALISPWQFISILRIDDHHRRDRIPLMIPLVGQPSIRILNTRQASMRAYISHFHDFRHTAFRKHCRIVDQRVHFDLFWFLKVCLK